MSDKIKVKTCAFAKCPHKDKAIDLESEEYTLIGRTKYYHKDCYEQELAKKKESADVKYIKDRWQECVSDTVVWSQLVRTLYSYINRGISSDYLVFTLDYVLEHKLPLHHPGGFRYYVDKHEIKEAYKRELIKRQHIPKPSDFVVEDTKEQPKIGYKIGKRRSFEDILK